MAQAHSGRSTATRARARLVALPLCHLLLALPAAAQTNGAIRLLPAARVEPGAPVTLADVATLSGPPAEALGHIILLPDGAGAAWTLLDAAAVRDAINEQARPVWGHLTLQGVGCAVRSLSSGPAVEPAMASDGHAEAAPTDPTTVRAVIEQRLAAAFDCSVADLRLEFDDRDAELLATSAIGRTVDAQPTGLSERLPLRVTVYEADRILRAEALRVQVLVRRDVAVSRTVLPRGHVIAEEDLLTDIRWLPPDLRPIPPALAVGMVARNRIAAGEPLSARDAETPILVRRGQTIQVHAVGGAVSLQIPARALEDGREGDIIRCASITAAGRSGSAREAPREFLARMAGPGIAVAVDEPTPELPATEPVR